MKRGSRSIGAIAGACACALAVAALHPASAAEQPSVKKYGIEIRDIQITMPDGVRLAAGLFLPAGRKPGERFPVVWELYPYRKDEDRNVDYTLYSYLVQRGYVAVRVDLRGTGASEGTLVEYEYTDQEHQDAGAIIDWLSRQPWSNGKVGMFGISWGAFNAIHLAMRNPPGLKAILAHQGTDDLFQDDVHFIDGMMMVGEYEIHQDLDNARPGAPDFVINEDYFRERFDTTPWLLIYKQHQRDGPFWDRASLNADYGRIRVPTYVIGGWYDGYRDSVPRMLQHLKAPVKGIIGPWNHSWPHWIDSPYHPAIEWRREAVRWFDYWLKGRDTGVMDEPRFAVYVRHWHPPDPGIDEIPGEWRWEEGWPIERTRRQTFHLQPDHTLAASAPKRNLHRLRYVPSAGLEAGRWWGEIVPDQRGVDAYSLVYDTPPLEDDLEILGMPRALLIVSADAPLARWFARLSDVAPDGTVTLVTGAGINGAHRESAYEPKALVPGEEYPLEIELHFTSWVFPKGHRIRLAVNNAAWPMIWPTPHPMTTTLRLGGSDPSRIVLPVTPHEERPKPVFLPPAEDPTLPGYRDLGWASGGGHFGLKSVTRDYRSGALTIVSGGTGGHEYPWGSAEHTNELVYAIQDDRPDGPSIRADHETTVRLEGRTLVFQGLLDFSSDPDSFFYSYTRRLLENGKLVREKTWNEAIPRDHQ